MLENRPILLAIEWNSLPDSCVNCTTVNMFKTHIASQLEPETHCVWDYCIGDSRKTRAYIAIIDALLQLASMNSVNLRWISL